LIGTFGGIATYAADLFYFPMDTIKTRSMASNLKIDYTKTAKKYSKF
jgi:hypothetical protein